MKSDDAISTSLRATHAELLACDTRIEDWDYLLDELAALIKLLNSSASWRRWIPSAHTCRSLWDR